MSVKDIISVPVLAGSLLTLSGLILSVGAILWISNATWKLPFGKTSVYLYWERSFFIAAVVVAVLGFVLLERMLEAAGELILAPLGLAILFIGAVLVLVAETYNLSQKEWLSATVGLHIVLAFLAQAVFGAALLQTGLLPGWVGWATIIWNLTWLVLLPIFRPRDIYYPWLHYVAPLLIGIALLLKG